ncbi:MAG: ABC transporter substrate-binding protein [Puniceicoccales bacterium]|nr:ABC transporter substrate-binding protein [Puniceicoccales bacterium]
MSKTTSKKFLIKRSQTLRRYPRRMPRGPLAPANISAPTLVLVACIFASLFALFFFSSEPTSNVKPPPVLPQTSGTGDGTSSASPATANTAVHRSTAGEARVPSAKRVVRAGLNAWAVLAVQKGWFAEEFGPLNADIELVDRRVVGNAEAALFEREDLHIAERMAYPSLQHKANGFDFVVVWASGDCHPRRATTIVSAKSPIKNLGELRGKRLGGHRLGCPYFATYEALIAAGVKLQTNLRKNYDVSFVNITGPAAFNALIAGELDALATHIALPDATTLLQRGLIREIAAAVPGGQYATGGGRALVITTRRYANKNPDLISAYLRVYAKARRYIVEGNHYVEAAAALAGAYRIPADVAEFGIRDEASLSLNTGRPDAQETIDGLHRFLKWAVENGDDLFGTKPLTKQQVEEFVDRRFFQGGKYYVETGGKPHPSEISPRDYKFAPTALK